MLLLNCRCLYIFLWYQPTICLIVYVAYEQTEIEKLRSNIDTKQHDIDYLQQQLTYLREQNTDTDIGMIVYYYNNTQHCF